MQVTTLAQQLLYNTVRLETHDQNGQPIAVGTSFVLSHHLDGLGDELFLVTNKHVVSGAFTAYMYFTHLKEGHPDIGNPFFVRFDMFERGCHPHPDPKVDLVVQPLSWALDMIAVDGVDAYLSRITSRVIPTAERIESYDAVEEILFIGYPNGIFDEKNYVPIVRRGTTATPIQLDYGGEPVFLIDASVFPGSSGSPVFRHRPTINGRALAKVELLGVVSAVFFRTHRGQIESRPAPTTMGDFVEIQEMIDLGVILKSHLILETIDHFWSANRHHAGEIRTHREAMRRRRSHTKERSGHGPAGPGPSQ